MTTARERVLDEARNWIGTPYRHQGSAKGIGTDCLGLVRGIWRTLYGREPEAPGPYAADWAEFSSTDRLMDAASRYCRRIGTEDFRPGDLLVFRWTPASASKHMGIASGGGRFIHAYSGVGVVESALVAQWRRRIAGVFSFPDP